ncbi:MAG TPA: nitrite reductase (NAD(P)H) small subunit [Terriglobia bacterium]|nr:nitrite reductase (NAD(P)H) small subunit [Terriglobia bacterium]
MAKAVPISTINTHNVNLGSIDAIPVGQGRCYIVGSGEVAVFRQRDGRLFAAENRCPHRQGPLAEGLLGDGKIICPLHSHQFRLEDGGGNEADECLQVYGVQEIDGNILLEGTDHSGKFREGQS